MSATAEMPAGVMDVDYARGRSTRAHLAFRLATRAEVVVRAVRGLIGAAPVRLLDIGAADGRTLKRIAERLGVGDFVGVEYNDALRRAHPRLPTNVCLIAGDALALSTKGLAPPFDVVSMLAVLEHLSDPSGALVEAFHVLRAGGLLVATCPDPFWDALAERVGLLRGSHHVGRIDLSKLQNLVEAAGYDILSAGRFMWAPIAVLPYAGLCVSPALALAVDALVERMPLICRLCVNAYVVGRRPEPHTG